MIFVTVGTLHFPFDRLLRAVAELPVDEKLIVQCAAPSSLPQRAAWVKELPYDELVAYMREARTVVCHAGVGSVLTALGANKRPIIVPRLQRYAEAVDDHQVVFGRRVADLGLATLVEDPRDIAAAVARTPEGDLPALGVNGLAIDLRARLEQLLGHSM